MKFLTCSLNSCTTFFKGTEGGKAFFFPFANRQCWLKLINNLVGYMSQLILSPIVAFLSGLLAQLLGLSISARRIHFGSRGLSDTSPKCIDPEVLEKLPTGTRKVTCTYCFFFVCVCDRRLVVLAGYVQTSALNFSAVVCIRNRDKYALLKQISLIAICGAYDTI